MAVSANRDFRGEQADLNETRKAVENAENRARHEQRKSDSRLGRRNDREYAQALHREADQLYHSGDYETALVLYHRAANLFPRDSSHSVAARRTAATISSCNNPSKLPGRTLPSVRAEERLTVDLCPESAAIRANERLKKSPDPEAVAEVLSYFDNHKSFWKALPSPRPSSVQVARSKMMVKQLNNLANASLENLEAAFNSGKMSAALKIAQELLMLSAGFQDPSRYQIAAYRYMSMIHVALGRHDRAVCCVSRLIRLAKSTEDVVQICRSLVTLGKVHLSFGHLNAAAKAWEYLSSDLKEPIPSAWIKHEIGRCRLETGKYREALEMGSMCLEAAMEGNSKKWMLYGRLLMGQSLAKMGRFAEALEELQIAAKITEEEGDTPMLSYIRDLIEQVTRALRKIAYEKVYRGVDACGISPRVERAEEEVARQSNKLVEQAEAIITTVFSQRNVITECHEEGSSSESSVDEEITMHSEKTRESAAPSAFEEEEEEEEEEEVTPKGGCTFRIGDPILSRRDDVSCSSKEEAEDVDPERSREVSGRMEGNLEKEEVPNCASGTSVTTVSTTATYVIEKKEEIALGRSRRDLDNDEERERIVRMFGGDRRSKGDPINQAAGDKTPDEEDMLNALRAIEELSKKDEVELLETMRNLLLASSEDDRSPDLANSRDTGRENPGSPASFEDTKPASPSLCKHSRPSSSQKCDANGDFYGLEKTLESK